MPLPNFPTSRLPDFPTHSEACRAATGEDRVVTADGKPALFLGDVAGNQRDRDIDIRQQPAVGAADVVMAVDALVEAAGLIGERQLLDPPVPRQQVQGAVNGAVGDAGLAPAHPLEDLAGRQVTIGYLDLVEDDRPLRGIAVRAWSHVHPFASTLRPTARLLENESRYRVK